VDESHGKKSEPGKTEGKRRERSQGKRKGEAVTTAKSWEIRMREE
jgi:hypothetical protein